MGKKCKLLTSESEDCKLTLSHTAFPFPVSWPTHCNSVELKWNEILKTIIKTKYMNFSLLMKEKALSMQEKKYSTKPLNFCFKFQLLLEESVTVPFPMHCCNNVKWIQWDNYCNMALSGMSQCRTSGSWLVCNQHQGNATGRSAANSFWSIWQCGFDQDRSP